MIELLTIGFTKKSAKDFFELIKANEVIEIVDTRVSAKSQLAGWAKGPDLAFFADAIAGIQYTHNLDYAPILEMMRKYRRKEMTWAEYETAYLNLLDLRKVGHKMNPETLHKHCLLCSEHSPEYCHRRLLAEYLQAKFNQIEIKHLL